jgi:hypothetical protein
MSHPIDLLRSILLRNTSPTEGVVVAGAGSVVQVRTRSGIFTYATNGISLVNGTKVSVNNSSVTGILQDTNKLPIYDV